METQRGGTILLINGNKFLKNRENKKKIFWKCHQYYRASKCPATAVVTKQNVPIVSLQNTIHRHSDFYIKKKRN